MDNTIETVVRMERLMICVLTTEEDEENKMLRSGVHVSAPSLHPRIFLVFGCFTVVYAVLLTY